MGRLRFMVTPFALVDLMAVLPFYLPFAFPELRFIRAFRLFRLFRILKLARYSESLQTPALPRFWPREKRKSKRSEWRAPTAAAT